MPKLIPFSELQNLKKAEEESSTEVLTALIGPEKKASEKVCENARVRPLLNLQKKVYYKPLMSLERIAEIPLTFDEEYVRLAHINLTNEEEFESAAVGLNKIQKDKQVLRILNEAICAKTVEKISLMLDKPFTTQQPELVVNEGRLCGMLSKALTFGRIFRNDEPGLKIALETGNLGALTYLRFFLEDPDAANNMQINGMRLVSYDFGLANCRYLEKRNVLSKEEKGRIPRENDNTCVFDLNPNNVISAPFKALKNACGYNVDFLATHFYPGFTRYMAEYMQDDNMKSLVNDFILSLDKTQDLILKFILRSPFKEIIKHELCLNLLPEDEQEIANSIMDYIFEKAKQLEKSLDNVGRLTPEEFDQVVGQYVLDKVDGELIADNETNENDEEKKVAEEDKRIEDDQEAEELKKAEELKQQVLDLLRASPRCPSRNSNNATNNSYSLIYGSFQQPNISNSPVSVTQIQSLDSSNESIDGAYQISPKKHSSIWLDEDDDELKILNQEVCYKKFSR